MFAPHFSYEELTFSQTAARNQIDNRPGEAVTENLAKLSWCLERLRKHIGKPIIVTSGFRCAYLNRAIGGSATSSHMQGLAADIVVKGIPSFELAHFARDTLEAFDFDQIINEFGKWVHIGIAQPGRKQLLTATHDEHGTTIYMEGLHDV